MTARLVDRTVGIGDGIDLHYVEAGAGRPLIIIPSWSLTGAAYSGTSFRRCRGRGV